VLDRFEAGGAGSVHLYFHGGISGVHDITSTDDPSVITLRGLLGAVYKVATRLTRLRFVIASFAVMDIPHGPDFAFDASNGEKYTFFSVAEGRSPFTLDSVFRSWPDGSYQLGDDREMANAAMTVTLVGEKAALAKMRLQWDASGPGIKSFRESVNIVVCSRIVVLASAITPLGEAREKDVSQELLECERPEALEEGLKKYLKSSEPGKATDSKYVVAVVAMMLATAKKIDGTALLNVWLRSHSAGL